MDSVVLKDKLGHELSRRHLHLIIIDYGRGPSNDREQEDSRHARSDGFKDPTINQKEADRPTARH